MIAYPRAAKETRMVTYESAITEFEYSGLLKYHYIPPRI